MIKHSGLRLALLLLAAALLPSAAIAALGIVVFSLLVLYIRSPQVRLSSWLSGVLRLKWLLISIAILYGWFTPGASPEPPQLINIPINLPSYAGMVLALERCLVLVALYGAVLLCLAPLKPAETVNGLRWVLIPLSWCRVPVAAFATRLGLCLARVADMQKQLVSRQQSANDQPVTVANWIANISESAANVIVQIEQDASSSHSQVAAEQAPLGEPNKAEMALFACTATVLIVVIIGL